MNKLRILLFSIYGELLKLYYRLRPWSFPCGVNKSENRKEKVIVSLTSYGRRVSAVLPYTIISLLRQTYKPDVILLWLDAEHWDEEHLPKRLKALRKYGLTIRYCEDIKSYKKLIPTLEMFPEDIIVTYDDDIFYRKNMLERLVREYQKDPHRIYTHRAHRIRFTKEGKLMPYNDWEGEITDVAGHGVFPTGVGGCLYKRSLLHTDICRKDLFMRLAPMADDVWFYFMEALHGTARYVLPENGYVYIPLDAFYQRFHKGASLASTNCKESRNDTQIRDVMYYYQLTDSDLREDERF